MSKFTKGDWYTKREGWSTVYVMSRIGGGLVQEVAACGPTNEGPSEQEANAQLIAAAKDLLEALEVLADEADNFSVSGVYFNEKCMGHKGLDMARAAIAKATGSQS